jgi:hypothetical protein
MSSDFALEPDTQKIGGLQKSAVGCYLGKKIGDWKI